MARILANLYLSHWDILGWASSCCFLEQAAEVRNTHVDQTVWYDIAGSEAGFYTECLAKSCMSAVLRKAYDSGEQRY